MSNLVEGRVIPRHVAIIMDGNRRWAKAKGLPVAAGHTKVVKEVVEKLLDYGNELGIECMTFWAFSTENWDRSKFEITAIMNLFRWGIKKMFRDLVKKGFRVRFIGDLTRLDKDIREGMEEIMELSKNNTGMMAVLAVNYGGRDELLRSFNKILEKLANGELSNYQINKELNKPIVNAEDVEKNLDTYGMPEPDFIIRTSGEQRMSGFMIWQAVYAEYYFPKFTMPDFSPEKLDEAMEEYGRRERRFGK